MGPQVDIHPVHDALHSILHHHHHHQQHQQHHRKRRPDALQHVDIVRSGRSTPTSAPHSPRLNGLNMHPVNAPTGPPLGIIDTPPGSVASSMSNDSRESLDHDRPCPLPFAAPLPHLPLRKQSSQRLRQRAQSPAAPSLGSPIRETFRIPRSVEPPSSPISTSAGRSRATSIASRPYTDDTSPGPSVHPSPFGSPAPPSPQLLHHDLVHDLARPLHRPRASSHTLIKPHRQLRASASIPNLVKFGERQSPAAHHRWDKSNTVRDSYASMLRREPPVRPTLADFRFSTRSGFTTASSGAVGTPRSSVVSSRSVSANTAVTSTTHPEPDAEPQASDHTDLDHSDAESDQGMTVEDAIDMYEQGFTDDLPAEEIPDASDEGYSSQVPTTYPGPEEHQTPPRVRRHSTTAIRDSALGPELPPDNDIPYVTPSRVSQTSQITAAQEEAMKKGPPPSATSAKSDAPKPPAKQRPPTHPRPERAYARLKDSSSIPRDCYGFKKATQYITVEQYDAWNRPYTDYVERRRKKWQGLMKSNGLSTEQPTRFPPRSEKMKRYIRKGIPPEWRGQAWFWYGGGPARLAQNPGLYWDLVEQVSDGKLSEQDREHIERDLNRTFPDNVRFRPESRASMNAAHLLDTRATELTPECETPILRALRRVLQAFAVHNPGIGYCQSLNFLAGLLLVFLDEDEEKAFILLDIITSVHLPGTHGRVLEANIDIGVLMQCIRESMPAIWNKIDDTKDMGGNISTGAARLPTVSLAMTSWFMSLFVGNFPIETVLRVWDSFFYEGSKTLFRIALAVLKMGEAEIRAINDPMEIFQIIQTIPRRLIDPNTLMEACFRRRNGFGHVSQATIDIRRIERRKEHQKDMVRISGAWGKPPPPKETETMSIFSRPKTAAVRRAASRKLKGKRRARTDQVQQS